MGINRAILKLYSTLYKKKIFEDIESVMELGSQVVYTQHKTDILRFLESLGRKNPKLDLKKAYRESKTKTLRKRLFPKSNLLEARHIYRFLGVKKYECIDSNGEINAHVFDLNENINTKYNYKKRFDLVTNNGTTEHVFNQYSCFKNMHDLTNSGGYMVHVVPLTGYLEHGFYSYNPSFFIDLAFSNNYEIKCLLICINDDIIKPYSEETLTNYLKTSEKKDILILCLLKKTSDKSFKMPFQGKYLQTNKVGYLEDQSNIKFSKPDAPLLIKLAKKILNLKI